MSYVDVGSAAIDRDGLSIATSTVIDLGNPALVDGIINNIEIWANTNITGLRVGTFYLVSGNDYKCRDSATVGSVTAGSKQTFTGLSIVVKAGDFIGCYFATGLLETSSAGGSGRPVYIGEAIDPGDQATYIPTVGAALSLYGEGTNCKICRIAFDSAPYDATPIWTDVSSDLRALSIRRGRQHALDRMEAGTIVVTLDNRHYNYYPKNANGDYSPNVLPGKRLNILVVYNAVYEIFTGYITEYRPSWQSKSGIGAVVDITAVGLIGNLALLLLNDDTGFDAEELSGTRIDKVLDKLSVNIGRDLAVGQSTMQTSIPLVNENAKEYSDIVQRSELGYVFEAGDGDIQFHDRHTRLKAPYITSQAIFSDILTFESLPLYLPLWHPNLDGSSFLSRDQYHHLCTVTGAVWSSLGRTFDGSSVISAAYNAASDFVYNWTIIIWVKSTTTATLDGLTGKTNRIAVYTVGATTGLRIHTYDGVGYAALDSIRTGLWDGNWHCFAIASFNLNPVHLDIDGVSDITNGNLSARVPQTGSSYPWLVGDYSGYNKLDTGTIGEVLYYDRPLSPAERQAIYLATKWRYGL